MAGVRRAIERDETAVSLPMMSRGLVESVRLAGLYGTWLEPGEVDDMPDAAGAYLLALRLERPVDVAFRASCCGRLSPGLYIYAGSARGGGGIRARLRRHLAPDKKLHWHIDQLTVRAAELAGLAVVGGEECALIDKLLATSRFDVPLPGFGSSDCRRCASHLMMLSVTKR